QLIKKKVPFVVFFHGWDLDFEKKVDEKYVKFFLNSLGKAKKIFVLSNDFKSKLLQWGYNGDIIIETTTVNSDLLAGYQYDQDCKNDKQIKILFLSRLLKEKGVYETINAFQNLNKEHPDLQLIIAGDGEEYKNIEKLVQNDTNINMAGYVVGQEKINLLKDCHIYCLPSYTEGLPISVLEAMAFGLPVITTRVGGLKDFFHDGKMGYFVEPKNSKQLEEKLRSLLSDKDQMATMGMYNFNYANENLLSHQVAKRLYKHLEQNLKQ
ncbi:MAG: glycosyltransferase family 4 protein, partial [Maribacter sp.]